MFYLTTYGKGDDDMKHFDWKLIEFVDGSNPYVCKTKKEFNRMEKKWYLVEISSDHYKALFEKEN